MRQFILRITLALAFVGDYIVSGGLRKTRYNEFAEWNDILDGAIHADVVVSGSSRAYVHVDPRVLDSVLKCHSYNLGMDGSDFLLQYARMQVYLKHNQRPTMILQTLEAGSLEKLENIFQYEQFFPYFTDSILHNVICQYNGYTPADYIVPLIRYRHQHRLMGLGVLEYLHLYHVSGNGKDRGYGSVEQSWDSSFYYFTQAYPKGCRIKIDAGLVKSFENFLNECSAKNISVVLVYAPEYSAAHRYILNRDSIMNMYQNFSEKYNVPFLNYSDSILSSNRNYFYNSQHLNKTGAEKFSRMLARDVKKITD